MSESKPASQQPKVSAQMAAVMRVMAGQGERTIAEKLADANRPTWEQYKKDNEDKLNISGLDQKKMEEYRKKLDAERDKRLNRGLNHKEDKKSSKRKKKKRHRSSDSDSSDYSSDDDGRRSHKRKKHRKKSSKHDRKKHSRSDSYDSDDDERKKSSKQKKRKEKKRKRTSEDGSSSGDSYRLSSFFNKGSGDESDK
ncbi:hypothetical protein ACHAXM_011857 [Skeletonema potamos]|jgi:hypothetical protein